MHNIRIKLTFLLILLTTSALTVAQTAHRTSLPGIDVEMGLDRTQVVVGEPVALQITMTNTGQSPILDLRVNFQFAPGNGIELNIQPPGELPYRYLGAQEVGSYFSMPLRLGGQLPRTVDVVLLFDRAQQNGLLFSKPGKYTIQGNFQFNLANNPDPLTATLPPTQVTVTEPTGDDAAVLELLGKPAILALHVGAVLTTPTLQQISRAAADYPKTHLGALALRTEGLHYTRSATADERNKGISLLIDYLKNGVVHTGSDTIAWEIAAAHHRNKKYDLAREWVFWLVRNYPSSTTIQASDPLTSYYYIEPVAFTRNDPWYLVKQPWIVPNSEPPANLTPRQPDQAPQ